MPKTVQNLSLVKNKKIDSSGVGWRPFKKKRFCPTEYATYSKCSFLNTVSCNHRQYTKKYVTQDFLIMNGYLLYQSMFGINEFFVLEELSTNVNFFLVKNKKHLAYFCVNLELCVCCNAGKLLEKKQKMTA